MKGKRWHKVEGQGKYRILKREGSHVYFLFRYKCGCEQEMHIEMMPEALAEGITVVSVLDTILAGQTVENMNPCMGCFSDGEVLGIGTVVPSKPGD
jgi:hypothetical protein